MQVPIEPIPVVIDDAKWLIYELHLTNFSRDPLRLSQIEVVDGANDSVLQTYRGPEDIGAHLARPYLASDANDELLPPGQRVVVYLEVAEVDARRLRHRIGYSTFNGTDSCSVTSPTIDVRPPHPLALGAPLRGGPWAAIYHWSWPRGHRRVFYTLDGRARLPGRFAIDWVKLDDRGHQARGNSDVVKNALGYGTDVLAVADARVAEVRDGIKESDLVSGNPHHTLSEAPGNYVTLDLGDGRFAVYEHLKPNSIRVARGDVVRLGQVIAALGFTGDSTAPHLHFHVADAALPLQAEGVPYVFENFRVLGRYEDVSQLGSSRWETLPDTQPELRSRERPAPNAVISFDAQAAKH